MKVFITATPLFNSKMIVAAYQLCVRSGDKYFGFAEDHIEMQRALNSPGLELIKEIGTEPFAGVYPLLADISEYQLLMDYPAKLDIPPDKLICVLPKGLNLDQQITEKCTRLLELGYTIAYSGFPDSMDDIPLINMAEYMIFDYSASTQKSLIKSIVNFTRRKKLIVINIPSMQAYNEISGFSDLLYGGDFYNHPSIRDSNEISVLKVNALRLISQINDEDFDLMEIARTIEQDPVLSISLLRFINNTKIGSTRKIDSIRSAVAILGQREVRRWAIVAVSVQLASDRPGELTRLSLIRAKFAENLAPAYSKAILAPLLFITGLFSLLDVILEMPMSEAIKEIQIDERVKTALSEKTGALSTVLELVLAYERGDWDSVSINMIRNGVGIESISEAFVKALLWYSDLLESIE